MIPYLELPSLALPLVGPVHPYGMMVGLGAIAAFWTIFHRARQEGIPDPLVNRAIAWSVPAALAGAHLAYLVFGGGGRLAEIGVPALLRLWDGHSSLGGIAGALAGFLLSTRRARERRPALLGVLVEGSVAGWVFGRLGCAFAHDHPGAFSESLLAVRYPEGARHDLGLYEFLFAALVLLPGMLLLRRRGTRPLARVAAVAGAAGAFRFLLEFLRGDSGARWAGLTPAQFGWLALACGAGLAWRRLRMS